MTLQPMHHVRGQEVHLPGLMVSEWPEKPGVETTFIQGHYAGEAGLPGQVTVYMDLKETYVPAHSHKLGVSQAVLRDLSARF